MIRVLVVDDHPIVREGLKQILSDTEDILVVDEADSGQAV
ncbi:MAG: DNA-binding response regulator, partial [Bacteriovoracaceae bacterium]|nr:DNA-binding response regulator [Bacteriovoracaceae bacterium]